MIGRLWSVPESARSPFGASVNYSVWIEANYITSLCQRSLRTLKWWRSWTGTCRISYWRRHLHRFVLHRAWISVGPKKIQPWLKIMGRQPIYRRKKLTNVGIKVLIMTHLLKGLEIKRPNQVWCTDITFIPMRNGFMYLTAIMDVYSRKIVG